MTEKRLYRSTSDKYIAGVCGGLAEYFAVDPALFRIAMIILVFFHGIGLLAYLLLWIAVRKRPEGLAVAGSVATPPRQHSYFWSRIVPGSILIGLGLLFLIDLNWYWLDLERLVERAWPIVFIGLGLLLMVTGRERRAKVTAPEPPLTQPVQPSNGESTI